MTPEEYALQEWSKIIKLQATALHALKEQLQRYESTLKIWDKYLQEWDEYLSQWGMPAAPRNKNWLETLYQLPDDREEEKKDEPD